MTDRTISTAKRLLDLGITVMGFVPALFVMAIISVAIRIDSPGPTFFKQARIGERKKRFRTIKFRTMHHRDPDSIDQFKEKVVTTDHDPRITRVGRILRSTSLDELPQVFNVIRGDMSLVGPRPVLPEQLAAIPPEYGDRFLVKPGMTGLAQVRGRRSLNWLQQLKYDKEYVDNQSVLFDLKILIQTPFLVFQRKGVYGEESDNWRAYVEH